MVLQCKHVQNKSLLLRMEIVVLGLVYNNTWTKIGSESTSLHILEVWSTLMGWCLTKLMHWSRKRVCLLSTFVTYSEREMCINKKPNILLISPFCLAVWIWKTWPLIVDEICKLLVFDRRCLLNPTGVCWNLCSRNSEVWGRMLLKDDTSFYCVVYLHRLRLWRVLLVLISKLPRRTMLIDIGVRWKITWGEGAKIWLQFVRLSTGDLSFLDKCRLFVSGWVGFHVSRDKWLETLNDTAENPSESPRCVHSLSSRTSWA